MNTYFTRFNVVKNLNLRIASCAITSLIVLALLPQRGAAEYVSTINDGFYRIVSAASGFGSNKYAMSVVNNELVWSAYNATDENQIFYLSSANDPYSDGSGVHQKFNVVNPVSSMYISKSGNWGNTTPTLSFSKWQTCFTTVANTSNQWTIQPWFGDMMSQCLAPNSLTATSGTLVQNTWYEDVTAGNVNTWYLEKVNDANAATINGINYMLHNEKATVVRGDYEGDVVIPAIIEVNGSSYNVDAITNHCFFECGNLRKVAFESKIMNYFGVAAFQSCNNLSEVIMPSQLSTLGEWAFADCPKLMNINIPDSISEIANSMFKNDVNLNHIILPSSLKTLLIDVFYNTPALNTVFLNANTPPSATNSPISAAGATVLIPEISAKNYKSTWLGAQVKPVNDIQKSLYLPYGQDVKHPWTAKCYSQKSSSDPDANWKNIDFNDSGWGNISGPISLNTDHLSYVATTWYRYINQPYTYWLRRHFYIDNPKDVGYAELCIINDDGCSAYLNGTEIFNNPNYTLERQYVPLTSTMRAELKQGDNVLAVKINDTGSGDAYVDCGIIVYNEKEVSEKIDSISIILTDLNTQPQNKVVSQKTSLLLATAKSASGYSSKSTCLIEMLEHQSIVTKSIDLYAQLKQQQKILGDSINKAGRNTSPDVLNNAKQLYNEISASYTNGAYDDETANLTIKTIGNILSSLSLTFVEVNVDVPGSMGDSILSKVENFSDVQSLKLSGTLNEDDIYNIKNRLTNLTEIDFTNVNMPLMEAQLFYQRSSLKKVKLPDNLIIIGEKAFYQCFDLQDIVYPNTLQSIGASAFYDCNSLKNIILPEGLNDVGSYAFYSCDNVEYLKLPSTLTSINNNVFDLNVNLKKIDFSEGLKNIYTYTFASCYSLKEVTFPKSLYYIAPDAFHYDHALSIITFNEGLYQIGDNAFANCDSLKEITLPSTLVLANASPFDYCSNLRKVTCLSLVPPYIEDQIPYGCDMEGRELYVSAISLSAYKQDKVWDKFPTIKPIDYLPDEINVVDDYHFTLPDTLPVGYKPNVNIIHDMKGTNNWHYGNLIVNGTGVLSMKKFYMIYDPNCEYVYPNESKHFSTLINNSHLRADTVFVDMWVHNNEWNFISFPFNVKVSDIRPINDGTTSWVIYKYNGATRAAGDSHTTWEKMSADSVLRVGEGYILQAVRYTDAGAESYIGFRQNAINDTKKNNIFTTEDVMVALADYQSEFPHNRGWNLVGNPYPSYFDTRFMDIDVPITVWSQQNDTYYAYSPIDDSYVLRPGEAFFVQCPIEKTSVTFDKDGRQANLTPRLNDIAQSKVVNGEKDNRTVFNLVLSDSSHSDRTRIVLNEKASTSYESDKDANKFMSPNSNVPQIYSISNGVKYAINERPFDDGKVELETFSRGQTSITLTNNIENNYEVVLEDCLLGIRTKLGNGQTYTFSNNNASTRCFVLYISDDLTGVDKVEENVHQKQHDTYTLDGIKIEKPNNSGIYIHNRKKFIIKGK